jgi:hypothetical protein
LRAKGFHGWKKFFLFLKSSLLILWGKLSVMFEYEEQHRLRHEMWERLRKEDRPIEEIERDFKAIGLLDEEGNPTDLYIRIAPYLEREAARHQS